MDLDKATIGEFIDAAVLDPAKARQLLRQHPTLKDARWLCGETCLHFLAVEGFTDAARLLIELGFDVNAPNEFGDAPLVDVAQVGKLEIAEVLLAHGANPNAQSTTQDNVLHAAARRGDARLVQLLLSAGAKGDYVTDIGETVFDALPQKLNRRLAVERVLREYGIVRKPPQSDAE